MTLFHDNRRKDFIEQVVHHIATVSLLGMILFFSQKWTVIDPKRTVIEQSERPEIKVNGYISHITKDDYRS